MRILLIDVNCKIGSTGKIVYDLYTELNKQGHTAGISYGRGPVINEPNIYKFGIDLETLFHGFMNRVTGIHGSFSLFSTIRLINFINKFKPDIIHIHELHGYFVNIVTLMNFIKKKKIRIIWTFHCEFMYEAKGHVYTKNENYKWDRKKEYPNSWLFDFSKWNVKRYKKAFEEIHNLTIISPSEWLANRIRKTFLNRFDIQIIHNGVNQEIFKPKDSTYIRDKYKIGNRKIILSVAPNIMSDHKGGKYLLELAKLLEKDKYFIILIGVNESKIKFYDNILLIPKTKNQAILADFYSVADLFVITSKRENFPTTCLEALSCGTPVLGFNTGGTSETAPYPVGRFVKYGDIHELKKTINDNLEVKTSNVEQILKISNLYSKEVMLKQYMKLYLMSDIKK